MLTVPISARMASTAAPSPPFLSPRPTQRPAAMAAASVTRTSSRARLRSGAGRSAAEAASGRARREGPSGTGSDTGPPDRPPATLAAAVGELCCDPRGMTETGPTGRDSPDGATGTRADRGRPAPPAGDRRAAASPRPTWSGRCCRSCHGCLLIVGWHACGRTPDDPVRDGRPLQRRSSWPPPGRATRCWCPRGLPDDYRPTSARTDAGRRHRGRPGDAADRLRDARRRSSPASWSATTRGPTALAAVLDGATQHGTVRRSAATAGRGSTTERGETALTRATGDG